MASGLARRLTLLLVLILVFGSVPARVLADEGMFMPDTIQRLPIEKLKKRGLQIPITDIYNPASVSMKDAVVIVGGGTGEFVSPDGLLLTNHHVAFDALVAASEPNKDYATNGFSAHSRADELPARSYTVTITQELKNVTEDVLKGTTTDTPTAQRAETIQSNIQKLEAGGTRVADGVQSRVVAMNEGLLYYQFNYLILRDIRLVYAPPKSIGFFGGDPDNFEWPRHCGDFAFMRAYTGPDGKPAPYSQNNIAFKPKKFLPLSVGGVREGDFMMVLGYPGSTRRYRESYSVAYNQDVVQPFYGDLFGKQIEILTAIGENDSAARIKLQGTIFDLSNTRKNFEGSVLAMRRAGIVEKKRADEAAFTRWVDETPDRKTKYGEVLPSLARAYDELNTKALHDLIVQQLASVSSLLEIASFALIVAAEKEKPDSERDAAITNQANVERVLGRVNQIFSERNPTAEREMLIYLLKKAADLPPNQRIVAIEKRFGGLEGEARRRAEADFARSIIDSKRFGVVESIAELFKSTPAQLRNLNEPLLDFAADIGALSQEARQRTQRFNSTVSRWRPLLLQGMTEIRGPQLYPDANRTLRFSYGEVKGYSPREAITYGAFTTLTGVVEKDTGKEPFDVPAKLKQLFQTKDFGTYGEGTAVPVDFTSTTDIIGGNSGSPIVNGRGEQVGIIFDGNYEGLGNDFFYNETKGRAIAVDIRYVLFLTEKFGDAPYVLKELEIRTRGAKTRRK